jgi:hypothetical protein
MAQSVDVGMSAKADLARTGHDFRVRPNPDRKPRFYPAQFVARDVDESCGPCLCRPVMFISISRRKNSKAA